jgi:hypothetical protein
VARFPRSSTSGCCGRCTAADAGAYRIG